MPLWPVTVGGTAPGKSAKSIVLRGIPILSPTFDHPDPSTTTTSNDDPSALVMALEAVSANSYGLSREITVHLLGF